MKTMSDAVMEGSEMLAQSGYLSDNGLCANITGDNACSKRPTISKFEYYLYYDNVYLRRKITGQSDLLEFMNYGHNLSDLSWHFG